MTNNKNPSTCSMVKGTSFKLAIFSDVHLGHLKTPTEFITNNLEKYLINPKSIKELDMIIIAGDLFDQALRLNDKSVAYIEDIIFKLISLCSKYKVKLRVLEGTPSHDREQNDMVRRYAERYGNLFNEGGIDFRYIKEISVIEERDIGLSFLYVPDGEDDCEKVWEEVKEKLALSGLSKVDISIMHGTFDIQLPDIKHIPKHQVHRYLGISNLFVNSGHIHEMIKYKDFHCNGSFDRLGHGYESPKGYWKFDIDLVNRRYVSNFIINQQAMIYRTVDVRGLELEDAIAKVDSFIKTDNVTFGRYRIYGNKDDAIFAHVNKLSKRYRGLAFDIKLEKDAADVKYDIKNVEVFKPLQITKSSISSIVESKLKKMSVPEDVLARALALLEERINA